MFVIHYNKQRLLRSTRKRREKFVTEQNRRIVRKSDRNDMKAAKEDRRSRRTRQLLGAALVELMLEKRYDTITVQDILDRADVGRSTFYAHYTDKEDLVISEIARVIHQLELYTSEMGHGHVGLLPSLAFFHHVYEHRRLMQAFIWGRGAETLIRDFQARVSQLVTENLSSMTGDKITFSVPVSVVANFMASTLLMLIQWWIEENMRHSPDEIDVMFQKLVMPSLLALIASESPPLTASPHNISSSDQ
jgi:AcrR family transcriptional regulator